MQHRVLEDLYVVADAYRAMRVTDHLHTRTDHRAFADDNITGELSGWEEPRRWGDRRHDVSVCIELTHGVFLRYAFDGDERRCRQSEVAVAQQSEAGEIVGRRAPDDARGPSDDNDIARQRHVRGYKRALTQKNSVTD